MNKIVDTSAQDKETHENICSFCSKQFKTVKAVNRHEKSHIRVKSKKCHQCPELIFSTPEEYFIHLHNIHQGRDINDFICSECGKQFKTKSELRNHINSKCGTVKLYKCEVCNQELMTPGSLYNHMLRHKGEPSYMCGFCAKLFLTAGQLKVHERIHTQERVFVCNICSKSFCHRQSLITHSTLHTGIKPYLCENCGQSFSCVGNLLKHRKTHTECGLTPLTTHRVINPTTKMKVRVNTPSNAKLKKTQVEIELQKKMQSLKTIEKSNTDTDIPNSKSASETETNDIILKNQLNMNDLIISRNQEVNIIDDLKADIHKNNVILQTNFALSNIIIQNSKEINANEKVELDRQPDSKNYTYTDLSNQINGKCKQVDPCDTLTNVKGKISKLKQDFFKITKQELKAFVKERGILYGEDIACKYCKKGYCEPRWLLRHEKECNKLTTDCKLNELPNNTITKSETVEAHKCSCCKESFSNKDECKNHQINTHADLLTCQECDKIFSNPDSLRSHKNTFHKGIPKKTYTYVCERCGKQFRQKSALLHHEQNNCGDGPLIQCHVCHKSFSSVHVRKSHMRVHNAEKKLRCKFCGKHFHWKGQMKIHERKHTGEKPFNCLYCPKAFAYRESLITHSSLHTGIKPYLCEACGSRFSCIGNLIKHKATYASSCGLWYAKNKNEYVQTDIT